MNCKDIGSGTSLLKSMMLQLLVIILLSTCAAADLTGEYLSPAGCTAPNCDYTAKWSLDVGTDVVSFTITAKQATGTWTGIAFGLTPSMENQDTIYGYVDSAGASHVVDAYVGPLHNRPVTDSIQNLQAPNIAYANGIYTMTFKRVRVTGDTAGDVALTDTTNLYFKYPVGGGPMLGATPNKHTNTPMVSPSTICVCQAPTSPVASASSSMAPSASTMAPSSSAGGSTTAVMGPTSPGAASTTFILTSPPMPPSPPPSGPSPPPSPPPSSPSTPTTEPHSGPSTSGPAPSGPSMPPSPLPSSPSTPTTELHSGPSTSGPSMPPSGSTGPEMSTSIPPGTATLGSSSRTTTATVVAAIVAFVVLSSIICLFACCFLPERSIAIQRI